MDELKIVGCLVRQLFPVSLHFGSNLIIPDHETPFIGSWVDVEERFSGLAQPRLSRSSLAFGRQFPAPKAACATRSKRSVLSRSWV